MIALLLAVIAGVGIPFLANEGETFPTRAQSYLFNVKLMDIYDSG